MKKEIKVLVVGNDSLVTRMFKHKESPFFEYVPLVSDVWDEPDLLCFTGGEDVNPSLYLENPLKETRFNTKRDEEDISFFDKYPQTPKIGICRGGQLLNVLSGGAMWQHVDNHGMSHPLINLLPLGGRWKMGDILRVTSTHHQMMIPGDDAEVLGIAMNNVQSKGIAETYLSGQKRPIPDFDTEVVYYEKTNSLCYQPHPEYQGPSPNEKYFFDLLEHTLL